MYISLWQFKKGKRVESGTVVEELSPFQGCVAFDHGYSDGDSVQKLTKFWKKAERQVLQDILRYDPKRKDGSYM